MSEYFADKDQSFEMPNDDPSEAEMGNVSPEQPQMPDESGFSSTQEKTSDQQQDLYYMGTMALIIAVMIYILYAMFFSGGGSDQKNAVIEPVKVETPVAQVKVEKPVEPAPVIIPKAPEVPEVSEVVSSAQTEENMKIANQADSIAQNQQKIDSVVEESEYLTKVVRKIQAEKEAISQRFEDLEREVDGLIATNKEAEERIKQLEQKVAQSEPKKVEKVKEITYKLQAVVEGRAWIESSSGINSTVKVGDIIKDYGVVTKIDVVNSIINTSSGKTIKVD